MRKIILLVEDEPNDQELTLYAFKKNKLANEVKVVGDGAEAIDYLFGTGSYVGSDVSEALALILLDLKLPKIEGIEVLRRIRETEKLKNVPVVILSSSKEEKDIAICYSLGANSYIRKPVDFNKFVEVIQELGLYWLVLNESPPSGPARS